ncbi:MAG TPA: NifB/NifX family molybdenum-iron cluster-binding protein [Vicinamibacteria bacterium]|nr:NifB/NifX family molybdenum-iron cluster-binding protein [Vicinamibacteria bacterium]
MMRIAIPVTAGQIPNHLGHCETFLIADVEDGRITREVELANPGHGPGGPPPVFVAEQGVTHVLAWGMPPHAQGLFTQAGIKIQLGATGPARAALRAYLDSTLRPTNEGLDAGGSCGHSPLDRDA